MAFVSGDRELAILEQFAMGVLADVERGRMTKEQALSMLMNPLKQWVSGDPEGAMQRMNDAAKDWNAATAPFRS